MPAAKKVSKKKVSSRKTTRAPRGIASLKSKILKKIDRDLRIGLGNPRGLDSYYKDPGGGGGGVYGKGDNPVFGKSDPVDRRASRIRTLRERASMRTRAASARTKVAKKKAARRRSG